MVLVAHHQQGIADQLGGEVVAGIGHLLGPAEADPLALEDRAGLELEHLGGEIGSRGQTDCALVGGRQERLEVSLNGLHQGFGPAFTAPFNHLASDQS